MSPTISHHEPRRSLRAFVVRGEVERFQRTPLLADVTVLTADAEGSVTTEATVKIRVQGRIRHEVAEGDGPVNALDAALRKALHEEFPNLRQMQLVDYKVRVINSEAGTAAGVLTVPARVEVT